MGDTVAVVAVVVVVASVAGAAPVVASVGSGPPAQATPTNDTAGNETEMAPGERMAGVVGSEQAAVESEVTERAFGQRIAAANSAAAKARVVGTQTDGLQARLDELDAGQAELERAHENGTLSTGQYRARLAKLYVEQRALQRLANRTERVARGLPEQALQEQGVNVSAIRMLQSNAHNLTGPEIAEVARNVAGRSVGRPAGAGPPDFANETRGPPGNETRGPPDEDGPPGQSGEGSPGQSGEDGAPGQAGGNESSGQPGEQRGSGDGDPPGNETGPPGNETGPPGRSNDERAGNETASGDGDGGSQQPTDTGPGSGGENQGGNESENGNGEENRGESGNSGGNENGNGGENGGGSDESPGDTRDVTETT